MTLNGNDLTSAFIEFNLGFFRKPPPWAPSSPPRRFSLSLSLSNIPNVQPEVQIFSATALERQPSWGIAGNVTIWAPVRKRLQIRSLQLLWGTLCAFFHDLRACEEKTFHRWIHMNLSGHVYFIFHILLPDGGEVVIAPERSLELCWFLLIDLLAT